MPPEVKLFIIAGAVILVAGIAMLMLKYANWRAQQPYMSSTRRSSRRVEWRQTAPIAPVLAQETNYETAETPQQHAETEAERIAFAETYAADILARLILAEELNLTPAIKVGFGKKSGEGYQKYSGLVKAAMERQRRKFPDLTLEQQAQREALALER